jgi:hypothetical protein
MKDRRLGWIAAGVLTLTFVLAFPLREWVQRTIITPLAVILWGMNLFYRSMPQLLWWVVLALVVIVMLIGSLAPPEIFLPLERGKAKTPQGPVESLSLAIRKRRDGVYFKWLIANRLSKLAFQMLVQRDAGEYRSIFAPLVGVEWQPAPSLQKYLEVGLRGSFADYPESERASRLGDSPLDLEIQEAVEFLEDHLEIGA